MKIMKLLYIIIIIVYILLNYEMINSLLIKSKNRFTIKNLRMCKNLSSSSSSSISLFYNNLLHLTSE